jgi:outer membrane protein assembly factor BamB
MNKNGILRLLLMLALLIPIGLIASWGAGHSRPNHAWQKLYAKNENVYVLGKHFLRRDSMLTCLDANTGKFNSIRFPRHNEPYPLSIGFDGSEFWTMDRDRQGLHQLNVVSVPDLLITDNSTFEDATNEMGMYVAGAYIVQLKSDVVTVEELGSRTKTDSMTLGFAGEATLQQIYGTQNFLAVEKRNWTGVMRDFALLGVRDGKILQMARWKALDCQVNDEHSLKYITCLLPDGTTIETLDANDGTVYCSKPLPDDLGLRLPLVSLESQLTTNWIHWNSGGMNVLTGATFKTPENTKVIWHDVKRQRLFCREAFGIGDKKINVLDEQTGIELFRFELPVRYFQAEIQFKDDQLLVATRDGRLYFHDVGTGTLVRSVDPFRSVHWINCICGLAFLGWCVLWSRLSTKMHTQGWVDLLAYAMPILGYVWMRLHDQTAEPFSLPVACIVSFGVCLGLTLLASVWFAIGGVRWSLGALPLALSILFGIGFHSLVEGGYEKPYEIEAFVLASLTPTGFLMLLKWNSVRFCPVSADCEEFGAQGAIEPRGNRFPLRDLFLWTAVFGILFAMQKGNLCIIGMDLSVLFIAIPIGIVLTIIAMIALWLANFCSERIASRVARATCVIALTCLLFSDPAGVMLFSPISRSMLEYGSILFILMPIWCTVYFGLYAYRLRGWRIDQMH